MSVFTDYYLIIGDNFLFSTNARDLLISFRCYFLMSILQVVHLRQM